eukprot:COSAG05_NODE_13954_length_413_cov_0.656051_1_plen_62_part_10
MLMAGTRRPRRRSYEPHLLVALLGGVALFTPSYAANEGGCSAGMSWEPGIRETEGRCVCPVN